MTDIAFYARVSTPDQTVDTQIQELRKHRNWPASPVEFCDHISGSTMDRPGLNELVERCAAGEFKEIYTTRVSRFGRSLQHQIKLIESLSSHGVAVHFVKDGLTTSDASPMGRFCVRMFASIGQWELETLREQTIEGLQRARDAGVTLGRPKSVIDWQAVDAMRADGMGWQSVADALKVSRSTLARQNTARKKAV